MGKKLQEWFSEAVFPAEGQNLASDGVVRVRKGEARSLKSGGAWIYDNEVEAVFRERQQNEPAGQDMQPQKTLDGEIVSVLDFDGYFLGYGFYNSASRIRVRMLTRYQKDPVTIRLFREKVQKAWDLRKAVVETDSCRLIFGEADFLPGLTVDKFGSVLVVESLCLGMDRWKLLVLKLLIETLMKDGIEITGIYERSDARARELEGMPRIKGFIGPEFPVRVPIVENGVHYLVDVQDGQKTGFFSGPEEKPQPDWRSGQEALQRWGCEGPGLLHPHRLFWTERGDGRRFLRPVGGRLGDCDSGRQGACAPESV